MNARRAWRVGFELRGRHKLSSTSLAGFGISRTLLKFFKKHTLVASRLLISLSGPVKWRKTRRVRPDKHLKNSTLIKYQTLTFTDPRARTIFRTDLYTHTHTQGANPGWLCLLFSPVCWCDETSRLITQGQRYCRVVFDLRQPRLAEARPRDRQRSGVSGVCCVLDYWLDGGSATS